MGAVGRPPPVLGRLGRAEVSASSRSVVGTARPVPCPLPRSWAAVAPVLALALAACGSGGGQDVAAPSTTTTTTTTVERTTTTDEPATTTSTTSATVDPAAVPEVIDAAYVQSVMDRFDVLLRDAYGSATASGSFDAAFEAKIRSIYGGPEAEKLLVNLRRIGVEPFADPPGLPTTVVRDVTTARRDCVFLTAERDLTPLSDEPYEQVQPYYLQLVAAEPGPENPMPWVLARDVYFADASTLEDQCA